MSDPDSPLNHDPIHPINPIPESSPAQIQSSLPPPVSVTDLTIASIPAASKSSRRLPPPCWTLEETIALIEGYRVKWYALNRGNLKANHWEEVAESVAVNCPDVTLKKTAVQCRHKMEKLRKKYRTEIQRARSVPVAKFISSWIHFKRMEAMENRSETKLGNESDDDVNYASRTTTPRFFNRNGGSSSSGGGIRIRIPTGVSIAKPGLRFPGANPRSGSKLVQIPERVEEIRGKRRREDDGDDDDDDPIASAIKLLGDTLLRTEETKMEMMREIETMRMDMEMKKTKMILESQQRIVEAFARNVSEEKMMKKKKKARRVSSDLDSESVIKAKNINYV